MFMTNSNDKSGELLGQERRRRWSPEQKLAMVRESLEPGQSVSVVARRNGIKEKRGQREKGTDPEKSPIFPTKNQEVGN